MIAYMRAATSYIIQCTRAKPGVARTCYDYSLHYLPAATTCYATGHVRTHASDLGLGPELGLIDLDALPRGALAAGLLHGAEAALPPHLAVPLVAQLLLARLPALAAHLLVPLVAQLLLAGLPALLPAAAAPCTHTSTEEHSRFIGQFLAIYAVSSSGPIVD